MIARSITKNSIMLALFAVLVTAVLAGTEMLTREKREASIRKVKSMALEQVIPAGLHDNILLDDTLPVNDSEFLKLRAPGTIYIARKAGHLTAFIIPTHAPDGYSGSIHTLVGVNLDGAIVGTRVISANETPGLGDKIDIRKSPWILNFNDRSLHNLSAGEWHVKKDDGIFDQFTGATITPRAVVASVHNALLFYAKNKATLIQQASSPITVKTPGLPLTTPSIQPARQQQ